MMSFFIVEIEVRQFDSQVSDTLRSLAGGKRKKRTIKE
jgi:hypothetical protein